MKLDVQERIVLVGLLPAQGDITTIKQLRELREALAFTDKETKALGLVQSEGQIRWNPDHKVKAKEINIGEVLHGVIVELLKDADKEKKLTEGHIPLWDKFVEANKK
jgi:hypothetical protein